MTFETLIGDSCSAMPPLVRCPCLLETVFLTTRTCSTSTVPLSGKTRSTRPVLPRSEPVSTLTVSLRRIFKLCIAFSKYSSQFSVRGSQLPVAARSGSLRTANYELRTVLNHFRCQRNNLQKLLLAQFAGNRPKDARANWLMGVVDHHSRVLIEADIRSVATAIFLAGADNNRL